MTVRTRFSPSPTGHLHIGSARTTLFSALYAAKYQGHFILRIEDTDMARSDQSYVASQMTDLQWLDIYWQEGPQVGGEYGPYWQSQRQAIYLKYYEVLQQKQLIYPCFCSEQELLLARKIQLSRGQAPRYSGKCRELPALEIESRLQKGEKPAWRFIVPKDTVIRFTDAVKGEQEFHSNDIGDFIIRRADGTAPFLFCNAIDDALMRISHVIRGEDHLANTPRQILLLNTLELSVPHYAHLALILGEDGTKLSKRHGSFGVADLRVQGYLPIAIINYLARLGHACDTEELLPFAALARHFNIDKISRSAARFDTGQLLHWQKIAVQALTTAHLMHWIGADTMQQVPMSQQDLFLKTVQANVTFPKDALEWAKIFFHEKIHIDADNLQILRDAGEQFFVRAELAVDKYGVELAQFLAEMKQTLNVNGKKLFMPLRIALTGKSYGPELAPVALLLGAEKMKHRFAQALRAVTEG